MNSGFSWMDKMDNVRGEKKESTIVYIVMAYVSLLWDNAFQLFQWILIKAKKVSKQVEGHIFSVPWRNLSLPVIGRCIGIIKWLCENLTFWLLSIYNLRAYIIWHKGYIIYQMYVKNRINQHLNVHIKPRKTFWAVYNVHGWDQLGSLSPWFSHRVCCHTTSVEEQKSATQRLSRSTSSKRITMAVLRNMYMNQSLCWGLEVDPMSMWSRKLTLLNSRLLDCSQNQVWQVLS
jgi:hypothetical protein